MRRRGERAEVREGIDVVGCPQRFFVPHDKAYKCEDPRRADDEFTSRGGALERTNQINALHW